MKICSLVYSEYHQFTYSCMYFCFFISVRTKQKQKILRRGGQNTQNYTKHDPDNHSGVITHLEPDILECEVKWALGSATTNKASGDDGISAELFPVL